MYDVFKGDIVAVIKPTYIDFPGGRWVDHFVDKKVYSKAIDSKGRLSWLNRVDVIELK